MSGEIERVLALAHSFGCKSEVATLLPVIRPTDNRSLFQWDKNWSAATKYKVHMRHRALMANCLDDVEFFLKLYRAWLQPPWMGAERTFDQRKVWAQSWFVNTTLLEDIKQQKERISRSNPGFSQLDTVRILLGFAFPNLRTGSHQVGSNYIFEQNSFKTLLLDVWLSSLGNKRELKKTIVQWNRVILNQAHNQYLLPRLFIEQFFPPDALYICRPAGTYGSLNVLQIEDLQAHPMPVFDEVLTAQKVNSLPNAYRQILALTAADVDPQWRYRLEISDYGLSNEAKAQVFFSLRKASQIEAFTNLYNIGSVIQVEPVKTFRYQDTQNVTVAIESETQASVLIPNQAVGTKQTVRVESIDSSLGLVVAGSL